MKLYDYLPSGNSYKVRLLMSYLGLTYEHVLLDIHKGETQTDDYKSKNPVGQIPLLELSDGRRIAESNAILFFLAKDTPYWPGTHFEQTKALQWMFFEQYKHEPSIAVARFIRMYAMESRAGELDKLMARGASALSIMEQHLAENLYFASTGPSAADIALYAYTHVAGEGGFELSDYPNVLAWLDRMGDHPRHIRMTETPML